MSEFSDRASVVLHGFVGGIVNNANVALRLGELILGAAAGREKSGASGPLAVKDNGDCWSITDGDREACGVDIRKSDAAVLAPGGRSPSQILQHERTVQNFAAILAENAGGPNEASRQSPFVVTDRGDTWSVRGSRNADRSVEGPGAFRLELCKRDARVLDMSFEGVLHLSPEVKGLLGG